MATPQSPDAVAKVLHTAEILEHILSSLPLKDIVKAQRACKQWKAVIKMSPTLRRLCFLDPESREIKYYLEVYPHFWSEKQAARLNLLTSMAGWDIRTPHPFLKHMFKHMTRGCACAGGLTKAHEVMRVLSWPSGSWEDAFLTQPPIKKLKFQVTIKHPQEALMDGNHGRRESVVEDANGIRLGRLVEEFRKGVYYDGPVPRWTTHEGHWPWMMDLIGFREVRDGDEGF